VPFGKFSLWREFLRPGWSAVALTVPCGHYSLWCPATCSAATFVFVRRGSRRTSPCDRMTTVGSYLLDRLAELGVGHVFGVTGDFTLAFLRQLLSHPAPPNCPRLEFVNTCNGTGPSVDRPTDQPIILPIDRSIDRSSSSTHQSSSSTHQSSSSTHQSIIISYRFVILQHN